MTAPTPDAAEIERLADETLKWGTFMRDPEQIRACLRGCASALRALADARSDADNARSRYKAQVEGLEQRAVAAEAKLQTYLRHVACFREIETVDASDCSHKDVMPVTQNEVGLERRLADCERMLAEADAVIATGYGEDADISDVQREDAVVAALRRNRARHTSRLAAAKEKPDG